METQYYYDKDSITTGPFSLHQLIEMERQGLICPDTRILVKGDTEMWTTWAQVDHGSASPASDSPSGSGELPGALLAPETDAAPWCWGMAWITLVFGGIVTLWSLISIAGPSFRGEQLIVMIGLAIFFSAVAGALYALGSIVRWLHIQTEMQKSAGRHPNQEE